MPLVLALLGCMMLAAACTLASGSVWVGGFTFVGAMFVYQAVFMLFLQTRDNAVRMHNIAMANFKSLK